jgi:t-SNARE complex subunit (syntaxin)
MDDGVETEREPLLSSAVGQHTEQQRGIHLHELQARDEEIQYIHSTMLEVHGIYRDIGVLTNEQQCMLDNIESNVENALGNSIAARQQLGSANRKQKKNRTRYFCTIFLAVLIFVFIGTIIASL